MKRSLGFTLIEMAIVLVIIGLVVSAAVRIITPLKDVGKTDVTLQHLAIIDKALQLYVVTNGCLPCPADGTQPSSTTTTINSVAYSTAGLADDGTGATTSPQNPYLSGCTSSSTCRTTIPGEQNQTVPWITLGLSEDDATDGWGDRIRYVVDGDACYPAVSPPKIFESNGMLRCSTSGASAFPTGNLTVNNNDGGNATNNVAYVLISSGGDHANALIASTGKATGNTDASGSQFSNAGGVSPFYKGSVNNTSGTTHFDDIVLYKTAPLLVMLCGSNACGNPA